MSTFVTASAIAKEKGFTSFAIITRACFLGIAKSLINPKTLARWYDKDVLINKYDAEYFEDHLFSPPQIYKVGEKPQDRRQLYWIDSPQPVDSINTPYGFLRDHGFRKSRLFNRRIRDSGIKPVATYATAWLFDKQEIHKHGFELAKRCESQIDKYTNPETGLRNNGHKNIVIWKEKLTIPERFNAQADVQAIVQSAYSKPTWCLADRLARVIRDELKWRKAYVGNYILTLNRGNLVISQGDQVYKKPTKYRILKEQHANQS